MVDMLTFEVLKKDISQNRWDKQLQLDAENLADGEVLFALNAFSFTANNITYADLGEEFYYWHFFSPEGEWGRIPCWGFAEVEASKAAGIYAGEIYYGFFPMSTHLKVQAGNIAAHSFYDVSQHRAALPKIYNQYTKSNSDKTLQPFQMLFRPLFTTSFLLADYLKEQDFFKVKNIIITSASSKTALGLAYILSEWKRNSNADVNVIGMTSFANVYFVSETGYYDKVLDYQEISAVAQEDCIVIDMAGNKKLLLNLDNQLNGNLKQVITVGKSHWNSEISEGKLKAASSLFFAPSQAQKRMAEWGAAQFSALLSEQMTGFYQSSQRWLKYVFVNTKAEWELIYKHGISGGFNPESGYIINIGQFEDF
jgi:hypothetical protein